MISYKVKLIEKSICNDEISEMDGFKYRLIVSPKTCPNYDDLEVGQITSDEMYTYRITRIYDQVFDPEKLGIHCNFWNKATDKLIRCFLSKDDEGMKKYKSQLDSIDKSMCNEFNKFTYLAGDGRVIIERDQIRQMYIEYDKYGGIPESEAKYLFPSINFDGDY